MKCIVFWEECSPENREKALKRGSEWNKDLKQNPEKYPRDMRLQDGTAIRFAMTGQYKGFSLNEVDNEEQMRNLVEFWIPLMKFTFVPINQTGGAKRA